MANQREGGSAAQNKRTKIIVTAVVIAVALLITFAPYRYPHMGRAALGR